MSWPDDRFPSPQEIREKLLDLQRLHPTRCTVADLANPTTNHPDSTIDPTIVRSFTGNFIRVGRAAFGATPRSKVIVVGGQHAREWSPPRALVTLAENLLTAHAATPQTGVTAGSYSINVDDMRAIHEQVDLIIAPMTNPDGYEFSRLFDDRTVTDGWRKNRRPAPATLPSGCSAANAIGVDVNRNYDVVWDFEQFYVPAANVQASKNPCEDIFIGSTVPFSEPESRNVKALVEAHDPKYFIDCHMFGQEILHLWGTEENGPVAGDVTPPLNQQQVRNGTTVIPGTPNYLEPISQSFLDEILAIAGIMSAATGVAGTAYTPTPAGGVFPKSGVSRDWAFARNLGSNRQICRSFTLECGVSFLPVFRTEYEPVEREIHAALLALLKHASAAGASRGCC